MAQAAVGATVLEYERRFAEQVGAAHAWAFELGRHALAVSLKALGVGEGHRVGICAFSCLSVYEAVAVLGAHAVFLDIDQHLCIDPEALQKVAPELSAVVVQHTFGNPGQLDKLLATCREHEVPVVEDCAHALGSSWQGRPLGSFGVCAVYSFEWGKPYSTGQGGMLTTNSIESAQAITAVLDRFSHSHRVSMDLGLAFQRFLRETALPSGLYSAARRWGRRLRGLRGQRGLDEVPDIPLFPSYVHRCGPLVARAGLRQLGRLPRQQAIRRTNADLIEDQLRKAKLDLWPCDPRASVIALRYPLFVENKRAVLAKADTAGVELGDWYQTPLHPITSAKVLERIGYRPALCPNAERAFRELVHLPTAHRCPERNVRRSVAILAEGGNRGA